MRPWSRLCRRSLVARRVRLDVERGVRYIFNEVRFTGLQALEEDAARQYFMGEPVLLSRKSSRVYSPALLRRAVNTLEAELQRLGYAEAQVTADAEQINRETGEVDVVIEVSQGPRWLVTSLRTEGGGDINGAIESMDDFTGEPWSELWQQKVATEIRNYFYKRGFPDAKVRLEPDAGEARAGVKAVAAVARINTGEAVTVGKPAHRGCKKDSRDRFAAKNW